MATSSATTATTATTPAIIPPSTETLHYRLITGNIAKSGGQRGSLTRCAQKFGVFQSKLLASEPDAEAIETAKKDLAHDLTLYQLELSKLVLLQRKLEQQVECNRQAEMERTATLEALTNEVQKGRVIANKAQETRKCYLEYEAMAKLVNEKHPQSSRELNEAIVKVKEETQKQKEEEAKADQLLKVRGAQFQLMMQYMLDLKRTLNDKDEEEKLLEDLQPKTLKDTTNNEEETDGTANGASAMDVDDEEGLYQDL